MNRFRTRRNGNDDHPDPAKARSELDRVRRQRGEVDRLVADLMRERELNHFTANVVATFRGGK